MTETTYEKVSKWNQRCGKIPAKAGTEDYWTSLSNQADRIEEELVELRLAIAAKDAVETFDALLDLDVVVAGGLFLFNGDYVGGITAVLDNNDLKYTRVKAGADYAATCLNELEVTVKSVETSDGYFYSVHRNSDDKIMKFPGHPPVDLSPFVASGGV